MANFERGLTFEKRRQRRQHVFFAEMIGAGAKVEATVAGSLANRNIGNANLAKRAARRDCQTNADEPGANEIPTGGV